MIDISDATAEETPLGPIDYVVLEFTEATFTGEGFPLLMDLVERRIIRILDAAFIKVNDDGSWMALSGEDITADSGAWSIAMSSVSELLDAEDLGEVASVLAPGSAAMVLVYENTWAGPFAAAMRRAGGEVVTFGRIAIGDLLARLESLESLEKAAAH